MFNQADYSGLVAAVFCIESLTHVSLHCNKESDVIPTLKNAIEKQFLQNLEHAEFSSISGIPFSYCRSWDYSS